MFRDFSASEYFTYSYFGHILEYVGYILNQPVFIWLHIVHLIPVLLSNTINFILYRTSFAHS